MKTVFRELKPGHHFYMTKFEKTFLFAKVNEEISICLEFGKNFTKKLEIEPEQEVYTLSDVMPSSKKVRQEK